MSKVYMQKPVKVEAQEFVDDFTAGVIMGWITPNSETMAGFVPRGHEHPMRRESERDRSRSDVHEDAPSFLVLAENSGRVRVDRGDFVVRGSDGEFRSFKRSAFLAAYDEVSD